MIFVLKKKCVWKMWHRLFEIYIFDIDIDWFDRNSPVADCKLLPLIKNSLEFPVRTIIGSNFEWWWKETSDAHPPFVDFTIYIQYSCEFPQRKITKWIPHSICCGMWAHFIFGIKISSFYSEHRWTVYLKTFSNHCNKYSIIMIY